MTKSAGYVCTAFLLILIGLATAVRGSESESSEGNWTGPADVAWIDSETVCVLLADAGRLEWVDMPSGEEKALLELPAHSCRMLLRPPKEDVPTVLYVSVGEANGRVLEITGVDSDTPEIARTFTVGHTPCGMTLSPDGSILYIANRFSNTVSCIDLEKGESTRELAAAREPIDVAVSPDGRYLFIANHLATDRADVYSTAADVTVVDIETGKYEEIPLPNGSNGLRDIELSSCGRFVFVTHVQANFLAIPSQISGGWINRNALSVINAKTRRLGLTLLLDDYALGAANPWGVRSSPDGRWLGVAHAGTDELSLIDLNAMEDRLDRHVISGGISGGILFAPGSFGSARRRIQLPVKGPRGLDLNDNQVVVAGYFSDALVCIDIEEQQDESLPKEEPSGVYGYPLMDEDAKMARISLGSEPCMTIERRGEMLFNDATICMEMWQSCASCHPDARSDCINWDLMNDGAGNPKNSKSMLYSHRTPPSMALGVRETAEIAVRSGIHHILFADRPEEEAEAIDAYLKSLKPVPSPRLVDGELSESAKRGEKLFASPRIGCAVCHPAPLFTDMQLHALPGTEYDGPDEGFDTPTLAEVWRTAPYWHDGRFMTIRELLVDGDHGDHRGQLDRLTPEELDDLIEYVLSL